MSDLISRQAVVQMLNTADRYVANSLRLCDTDKTFPQNEVFIVDDMYEGLEQLPSAEKRTNKHTETHECDLISRQAAIDALDRFSLGETDAVKLAFRMGDYLKRLPSAQPEPITVNIDHELTQDEYEKLRKDMANAPIVLLPFAQPEQHGHWVYGEDEDGVDGYRCNKCGFFVTWDYKHSHIHFIDDYLFCPHCNARMDEVEQNG